MDRLTSFCGLFVMLGLAWLLSNNRWKMNFKAIASGVLMQFILAVLILHTAAGQAVFKYANDAITAAVSLSDHGARFVFGEAFAEHFFAFKVLPTIIFISSLSYVFFHWGILQKIVEFLAWIMQRTMGVSGTESLVASANIFLGQTEAPLLVKPYIKSMTQTEIMTMMTSGMASVAGGVLAAYVGFGISAGHLLAASLMSAPASIVLSHIMSPEVQTSATANQSRLYLPKEAVNTFDAACRGAADGLILALNVGAMLIAFVALVAMINLMLEVVLQPFALSLTLQTILGWIFYPLAWVMGVPPADCVKISQLLGEKMVINEFVAYIHLGDLVKAAALSERATVIATYALCGFANFSSIAIQIGGIGSLEPSRKNDFARLGFKSMIAGTLASFMTACIAGILL